MNIGLSSASFYPDVYTENSIKFMSELGFNSGEIFLNSPSEYEEDFIKILLEQKEKYSFSIRSIHSFGAQYEPFLFDRYSRRRKDMMKYFKMVCRAGKMLGADSYTFHGLRYDSFSKLDMKFISQVYDELSYTALETGIKLAQENVFWCMSRDVNYLGALKEMCRNPVYFTLDIKQSYKSGSEPFQYIDVMDKDIINLHINDRDEQHICMLPGKGDVDFKKILGRLNNIGYKGMAIIEVYRENYSDFHELTSAKKLLESIKY